VFFFAQDTHPHLFLGSSPDSRVIAELLLSYGGFALLVLLIVAGLLHYMKRKFTAPAGVREPYKEAQDEGKLEIGFAVTALVIVLILTFFSTKTVGQVGADPDVAPDQVDIRIIGHQWWWEIRYPNTEVVTANIAHIPKGKRLLVALESADVVHDWWVSGLGRKMDAIPGRTNYFYLEADHVGEFEGACNEFCGLQHAWMRIKVVAHEQADYETWLASQSKDADLPTTETAQNGARLFQDMSCATCHSIRGTEATATIGPDLTHVASRSTLLSGKVEYSKENLKAWLRDPQAVKPGAHMPRFIFSESELDDLTDYLDGLK
jgi:cytochrome c oxidase subunit II